MKRLAMNYLKLEFPSKVLNHQVAVDILIPEGPSPNQGWPTLYLLHGHGESNSIWMRYTQLEHYVRYDAAVPLAVIMPNASNSFYTDSGYGNYWTYVSEELPEHMENMFHLDARRENRFAAGFSMGGFGAFKLALNKPERFAGAYSISGALDNLMKPLGAGEEALAERRELLFGNRQDFSGSVNDLETLAIRLGSHGGAIPELVMYCGENDFLIEANRTFDAFLTKHGIEHSYFETEEDGHTHRFANRMLLDILKAIKEKIVP